MSATQKTGRYFRPVFSFSIALTTLPFSPILIKKGITPKGEAIVPLIIAIVLLSGLKYFEVGPFAAMSWWWIVALFVLAFLWFEYIERMLGRDKRKAHEQLEKTRNERVKKTFK
ncbi:TIGR04438 family Trp-rich protein [Oxalicibacterium flavum]|uniref:TIGR04438 family Trp-rich protein n=1 Tax=Oxalicibacterium flavum TaxID=179467 RepID=UPI001E59523A|nr:TIGR04438 family Trp-rich protein [Oxalicibacterium flavum]